MNPGKSGRKRIPEKYRIYADDNNFKLKIGVDVEENKALINSKLGGKVYGNIHQVLQSPSTNTTVVTLVLKIKTHC